MIFRLLLSLLFLLPTSSFVVAQRQAAQPPKGTIAGRIMLTDDVAAAGVAVVLTPNNNRWGERAVTQATTDGAGFYRLENIPAGSYGVVPVAPAHVVPRELGYGTEGKPVTLAAGEHLDGVNFQLAPGGVITGRVTDADDRPVLEEHVSLKRIDERGQPDDSFRLNSFEFRTDDRGIYRIFGLPAGRYLVSVGHDEDSGTFRVGGGGAYYTHTFHPEARDEAGAKPVEVRGGGEASGVDIKLGRAARAFAVSGRFVNSQTGEPVVGATYAFGAIQGDNNHIGGYGFTGERTNVRGEFRLEGLLPNRYAVFLAPDNAASDFYGEPARFEVRDGDVSGVEVKVSRGASIGGIAVIENSKPAIRARITELGINAFPFAPSELTAPRSSNSRIAANGTFRVTGLPPGKYRFSFGGYPPVKGFVITRIERDGVELQGGTLDVAAGDAINNLRIFIAYGDAMIRGQALITGGELPPGARLSVRATRVGSNAVGIVTMPVQVDLNRRFVIDGLAAGEYELTLHAQVTGNNPPRIPPVKQNVTVSDDGETLVNMTLDLTAPPEKLAP